MQHDVCSQQHGIRWQAKRVMVECYKRLRTEDAAPGSAMSYRITVRQLEALVRLSEALARLRCSETITPAHVREVRAPLTRHSPSALSQLQAQARACVPLPALLQHARNQDMLRDQVSTGEHECLNGALIL